MNDLVPDNLYETTGNFKRTIDILKLAINDWPKPVDDFDEYEIEVRTFLAGQVNKKTVELILTDIDLSKYAWQAESLSQLIDVFSLFGDGLTLKDIIKDIKSRTI
jgi:hypothetical protein